MSDILEKADAVSTENVGWITAGVSTIIATLAGTVAALFRANELKSAEAIKHLEIRLTGYADRLDASDKKHEECLEDRIELSKQLSRLEGRLEAFAGHKPTHPDANHG